MLKKNKERKALKFLALLVFLTMTICCVGCSGLFYYPDNRLYVDVEKLEVKPEKVELKTSDAKKFYAWYFKSPEKSRGKILFFHGNAQNRSAHFFALYWILAHHYDFLIFDYPGYADSPGLPSQRSTTDAGASALKWLAEKDPQLPLILFGQSLGGNIAMYTETQNLPKPCAIVVDSTFKSYRKTAQRVLASSWITWLFQGLSFVLVRDSYSAEDHIAEISPVPLIMFHGEDDPVVNLKNGQDVFDAAIEPKTFYRVPGHGHTMAFNGPHQDEFRQALLSELAKACDAKQN